MEYYVIKKVGFFRRLLHLILTLIFKREVTVFEKTDYNPVGGNCSNWLKPHWLCPGCKEYQDWEYGCADEYPALCDSCWSYEMDQRAAKAEEVNSG